MPGISRQSILLAGLSAFLVLPGRAIEIRGYSAARHDRFTGFPAAPAFNPAAFYTSNKFTGLAWVPDGGDTRQQFALVTPRHLVCATHYQPNVGSPVRFLGTTGIIVDRTVAAHQTVMNGSVATDLTLVTLSTPIPAADGVSHFPYLNLTLTAPEDYSVYKNTALTIFGMQAKAGADTISRTSIQSSTHVMEFEYRINGQGQDDCYLVVGDSGSPSFATVNNQPALVGTHFLVSEGMFIRTGYDTLVPAYINELNTFLELEGYRMKPATIASYSLTANESPPPVLRQAHPAALVFNLVNSSAILAGNAKLALRFPAGGDPSSIDAPGWITETGGPGEWKFRRAKLDAGATSSITAHWTVLPELETLSIGMDYTADGSPAGSRNFHHTLLPSYAAWSSGLAEAALTDDPDHDGVTNLLEYAFGGDPENPLPVSESGGPLLPVFTVSAGATLHFPVREDDAPRGLSYLIEFSETLLAESWSTTPPPGFLQGDLDFSPDAPGFKNRVVSFDTDVPKRFCRVKVLLNE